jgi:hypothetical protein
MSIITAIWAFFGWKWFLVLGWGYLCALAGARNPQLLIRSSRGIKALAIKAEEKARALAARGK